MGREGGVGIPLIDPFGIADDPEMPTLRQALDPVEVASQFDRRMRSRLAGKQGIVELRSTRVTRYKPGRRCLIEYTVEVEQPGAPSEVVVLIGKVRARRFGKSGYRILESFWNGGFRPDNPDDILVPEPIGTIPEFRMWLQRKVPGRPATDLLASPKGVALARQIAEAAHKLHRAGVPVERRHTMADELHILQECLQKVGQVEPRWAGRTGKLLAYCHRLAAATPDPVMCGIHRDFYSDQVIVDGKRLYIIDFDLYCEGDPGLDIGNFMGHLTEMSLRTMGDPKAMVDLEKEMQERFVELSGEATRPAVQAYATLTLVRHIYLSTLFPDRRPFTGPLLELCEERLGVKQ